MAQRVTTSDRLGAIPAYIAGPFRASTSWGIAQNVRRAETIHLAACRVGLASICPHTNTAHFQGECSDEFWIAMTQELLRLVAAAEGCVIVVPDWARSVGTHGEVREAERLNTPTFFARDLSDDPDVLRAAEGAWCTLGEWFDAYTKG